MDKRLKIILWVFACTILVVVGYTVYLIKTLDQSASIELLFLPPFAAGWLYFIECVLFAIIYIKHFKKVWFLLLPVFLISSTVPIYNLYRWVDSLPVAIPKPGKLPVTIEEYNNDRNMIISNYKLKDLDSIKTYRRTGDTIINVDIDTIIYSPDKLKFFSILVITTSKDTKKQYCSEIRVGISQNNHWQIAVPQAGLGSSISNSISELKYEQRQEYYRYYSINGSSKHPVYNIEIWADSSYYYLPFQKP